MLRVHFIIHLTIILMSVTALRAQLREDTIVSLNAITVTANQRSEVIPVQTLHGEDLKRVSGLSVADALRHFAGLQVKDYGGIGGVKTVNVRSMGSNHTGVVYDGVAIGNAQNGQVDLGQFSLDNIEAISVYNGQRSSLLQPARDNAQAATVYVRTRVPSLDDSDYRLRASFKTGSFDLINPSLLYEKRLSQRVTGQVSAEWLGSSGRYKFGFKRRAHDGSTAYDTTATRHNGRINALRVEANLFGNIDQGTWQAKIYTYNSSRGIPGAIVNNVWRRGEHIDDSNTFIQGRLSHHSRCFTTLNNIKAAYYRTHYINRDEASLPIDNIYRQWELYGSTSNMIDLTDNWHASMSYDLLWNTMSADLYRFSRPTRFTHYLAVGTAWDYDRLKLQGSITAVVVDNHVDAQPGHTYNHAFTPAIFASLTPLRSISNWTLRGFYKQSYRMPTFNDLYYADMGNSSLKPERVWQYDIGTAWRHTNATSVLSAAELSVDAYYNYITDKIVAYPKGQQFRWTMLNLGRVDIRGVDVTALLTLSPGHDWTLTGRMQYTFQRAIDITSPRDSYYHDQIPYVPHHSGTASIFASWRLWSLNFTWTYVGERYNQPENIAYNHMSSWDSADLSLARELLILGMKSRLQLDVNNLAGKDYQVILNYPMPRRNFRVAVVLEI